LLGRPESLRLQRWSIICERDDHTCCHPIEVLYLGGAPAVDGLIGVADHRNTAMRLCEALHQLILGRVGILVRDVEAALENSGCGPEQPETEDKEVVEIERVGFSERLLVVGVELRWHR
jgi:hypothetical protein